MTFLSSLTCLSQQTMTVASPDNTISVIIENSNDLSYLVKFHSKQIVGISKLGFEFKDEPAMEGNFTITGQKTENKNEIWTPVVKSKHAQITDH